MSVSVTTHTKHVTHHVLPCLFFLSITTQTHHSAVVMSSHVCVNHNTYYTHHSSCASMSVSVTTHIKHITHHVLQCLCQSLHTKHITHHVLPCLCQSQHTLNISLIMYSHVCVSYTTHQTHHSSCAPMFVSLTTHIKHITRHVLHVHFNHNTLVIHHIHVYHAVSFITCNTTHIFPSLTSYKLSPSPQPYSAAMSVSITTLTKHTIHQSFTTPICNLLHGLRCCNLNELQTTDLISVSAHPLGYNLSIRLQRNKTVLLQTAAHRPNHIEKDKKDAYLIKLMNIMNIK